MSQAKGRMQRESRAVVMSLPITDTDDRWAPDPESVQDWPFRIPLVGLGQITGRQGLDAETGRLVEFSMTAQVELGGRWFDVARVDTCHSEVHVHLKSYTGEEIDRKVIFPIHNPNDVDRGWVEGEKMLIAGWEEHVRRWRRGR